ncbi:unnamed protein product [Lota lota]
MDEGPVGIQPVQPPPGGLQPPGPLPGFPPPGTPLEIQASRARAGAQAWDLPAGPMAEPPQWPHCGGPLGTCQALSWSGNGCVEAGAGDGPFHFSPRSTVVCGPNRTVKHREHRDVLSLEHSPPARRSSGSEPENVEEHGAALAQGQREGPLQTSCASPLQRPGAQPQGPAPTLPPASRNEPQEGFTGDQLRVVKHKPSFIVFRDCVVHSAPRPTSAVQAHSDVGGSSSATTEEEEDCHEDDEKVEEADFIPELLQYEGFLVSRRRGNLATSRKCLRRRRDVLVIGSANPITAVSMDSEEEEEDGAKSNSEQVSRKLHCL